MSAFLQNRKNAETEIFVFCFITFDPITIQTCYAPQNDRLNHSFVKDINVVNSKMARNGCKTAIQGSRKFDATSSMSEFVINNSINLEKGNQIITFLVSKLKIA